MTPAASALDVDQREGPLHRVGCSRPTPSPCGWSKNTSSSSSSVITTVTLPISSALRHRALGAVGEEQHVDEDHRGDHEEDDPQRRRDDPLGSVHPVDPRLLPVGRLVHPSVVRRLLGRRAGSTPRRWSGTSRTPRVDRVAEAAARQGVPLGAGHGPCVAGQLAGELLAASSGQELGRLDLLGHDRRLVLRARPRRVVGGERQEDDEAEQHGEAGGEDAEDP